MTGTKNLSRGLAAGGPVVLDKPWLQVRPGSGRPRRDAAQSFFLRTARLGFRRWSPDDLPLAIGLWGDPAVTRFIDARPRLSDDDVKRVLARHIETQGSYGVQYWPVFLVPAGELAGCCGLRPYDHANAIYEFGVHLRPAYWGRGLAQEAASAVMDYAFGGLGASALFAGHHPGNNASRHLLNKLGFQYTHTQHYAATGLGHPSYMRTRGMAPIRFL